MSSVRWPVLACTSIISFSADYFYDVPSVLHDRFIYNATACIDGRDKCLHLSPAQFDLLYAVYAWFGACVVPFSGMLADKLGSKGTLVGFGILFFIGSTYIEDEYGAFILMLLGRLVFGVGSTSAGVITSRIQTFWFREHEIGLAFAISIVAGRLGSVANFLFTELVADAIGLRTTLWLGTLLCGFGLIGAVSAGSVHTVGLKRIGKDESTENNEPFRLAMIKDFTSSFWLLALFLIFFYAAVFPFVAEAPKYFEDRFLYSQTYAGYIAGSTYDIALISPLFGYLSDRVGHRGLWVLSAPTVLFSGYVFLVTIPSFPPIVFCIMMGVAYTLVAAIAWSCAPFLVPKNGVGTAMGLLTSFQMFGVGVSNAILGQFLSQKNKPQMEMWADVMWFLASCAFVGLLLALSLNVLDWKTGRRLRDSQAARKLAVSLPDSVSSASSGSSVNDYLVNADSLSYDYTLEN